jgi:hypothetical protein
MAVIEKDHVARSLAQYHSKAEPSMVLILRLRSPNEDDSNEPIKFLEVNAAAVPAGIEPVTFGPNRDVPYATIVVEVTPGEYEQIKNGDLKLPTEWKVDPNPLFQVAA